MNTVAALTDLPHVSQFAAVGETTDLGRLVRDLMDEGKRVAAAAGVELHEDPWEMNVQAVRKGETEAAAGHYAHVPSMLDDVRSRRATEVDFITGALVREASGSAFPSRCTPPCTAWSRPGRTRTGEAASSSHIRSRDCPSAVAGRGTDVRVCVVGCGAVGSLFAAALAQLEDVEVWAYDLDAEHVAAINERGLRITGAGELVGRLRATTDARRAAALRLRDRRRQEHVHGGGHGGDGARVRATVPSAPSRTAPATRS